MKWISDSNILIVGLGLMGGSYAMALSRLGYHVSAIDRDKEAIEYALDKGLISEGCEYPDKELIEKSHAIIFGLYPTALKEWIEKYGHLIKKGTMVTDVTGIKECVVGDIQSMLQGGVEFIGAHPMAGREVYGVKNSDDGIFKDANYIVTPTDKNTPEGIEWCKSLGKILGFRHIAVLSPKEHDEMVGFLSQLTHIIAITLMTCSDNQHLSEYTGDSFRDLTRIARINENMWSEIFLLNKGVLLDKMEVFQGEFNEIKEMLEKDDKEGLKEKMRLSTLRRSYFDKQEK